MARRPGQKKLALLKIILAQRLSFLTTSSFCTLDFAAWMLKEFPSEVFF